MTKSKKPTHNICMKPRNTIEQYSQIGVAWERKHDYDEPKTSFELRLNRGVTLSWRDMEDMKVMLFKANQ